ncbi:MAG: hypothetical protein R3Y67_07840, partial [Eubacteriales bacterium]
MEKLKFWKKRSSTPPAPSGPVAQPAPSGPVASAPVSSRKTINTSRFYHTDARKEQYVNSENLVRKAVMRRGLDDAYRVTQASINTADEAKNHSATYRHTNAKVHTTAVTEQASVGEGITEEGLDKGGTLNDFIGIGKDTTEAIGESMTSKAGTAGLGAAAQKHVQNLSGATDVLDAGGNALGAGLGFVGGIYSLYQFGSEAIEAGKNKDTIAGLKSTKHLAEGAKNFYEAGAGVVNVASALGAPVAQGILTGLETASTGVGIAFAGAEGVVNAFKTGKAAVLATTAQVLQSNLKKASGEYSIDHPEQAVATFKSKLTAVDGDVARVEGEVAKDPKRDATTDGTLLGVKAARKTVADSGDKFMEIWNRYRGLGIMKRNEALKATTSAMDTAGNAMSVAGGALTLGGASAAAGAALGAAAMLTKLLSFATQKAGNLAIRNHNIKGELKVKSILQQETLKGTGAASENSMAGSHKGRFASRMMSLQSLDHIVQDIMDEVYDGLGATSGLNVTRDKTTGTESVKGKSSHGSKTTEAYRKMILYEMGVVTGSKDDLSNNINTNRAADIMKRAGLERHALYGVPTGKGVPGPDSIIAKNRAIETDPAIPLAQKREKMLPLPEQGTVRELEHVWAKVLNDNLSSPTHPTLWELPTMTDVAKKYGGKGKTPKDLVKTTDVNPFVNQWKADLNKKAAKEAARAASGAAGGAAPASPRFALTTQAAVIASKTAAETSLKGDASGLAMRQRNAGQFAAGAASGTRKLSEIGKATETPATPAPATPAPATPPRPPP